MKRSLLLSAFIFIAFSSYSKAYEDKITYDKKKQACIAIDYTYPAEAVENAIIDKFKQLGYKVKEEKGFLNSDKGFLVFKNAYVTDISRDRFDYIIKVERKSRKEKDESQLYMILYKNDENALDRLEATSVGRAKTFLNNLLPDIEAANLELQIKDMEDQVNKSEKKLKTLQEDKLDLEKKLEQNAKDQDETIKNLDNQRLDLDNLRGKRKR